MRLIVIMYLLSFCGCLDAFEWSFPDFGFGTIRKIFTSLVQLVKLTDTHKIPDVYLFVTHIIRKAGYPAESHSIMTEDGYLLTLHRIPGSNGSPPVLLQHGLLTNSLEWIVLGKGKALAYLLADAGYDVWLGNFRGNTYSKGHDYLSTSEERFWDFSFHEMGIYDLPAMIKHIKNVTNKPLHTYIGHSMGASSFYIMASEHPEIAQEVQMMISLAPAVFLNHMEHNVKYVLPVRDYFESLYKLWNDHNEFTHGEFHIICDLFNVCIESMAELWGYDKKQFNHTLLDAVFNHNKDPASTSVKTLMHFAQIIKSGKFEKYDFGSEENLNIYKSSEPQEYNLRNITVPIILFYSSDDLLINKKDVERLYRTLPNVVDMYEIPSHKFSHMAYMFSEDAPQLYQKVILKDMKGQKFNQKYG